MCLQHRTLLFQVPRHLCKSICEKIDDWALHLCLPATNPQASVSANGETHGTREC